MSFDRIAAVAPRSEKDLFVRTDYRILYEDEVLLAAEKPAPLPVHAARRFQNKNLLSLLMKDLGDPLHLINRLDSETSGIVLLAKSSEAAGQLGKQFESRRVLKKYAAVVLGRLPAVSGRIEFPLGTKVDRRLHMRFHDPEGEAAVTDYRVLEEAGDFTFVELVPQTGRTHQLRAHLAMTGHPIAGDKLYIDPEIYLEYAVSGWKEEMLSVVKCSRLALHATRLELDHPVSGERLIFESAFPGELQRFFRPRIGPQSLNENNLP